jgi:PQQ-dependent catabolism-associated CXXCW motif protein
VGALRAVLAAFGLTLAAAVMGAPAAVIGAPPAPALAAPAQVAPFSGQSAPEPAGFWTGPINSPVPRTITGGKVIRARQLASMIKEGRAVIVDVSNAPRRPDNMAASAPWLPLPHHAIPGAVWIPGAGLGETPPALDRYFHDRLATITANDLARPLVIYCHERCWLSWNGARRAIRYGYRNVYWFPDGIEGWRKAKLPTEVIEPEATP